jgi:putative Holliday junction resolvase
VGRIIGIDYGSKRSGIAITDPLQMIASGLETVASSELVAWIQRYLASNAVECIVVGCPLHLDGKPSETMTKHVVPFVNLLKKKFPNMNIVMKDERFTSKIAAGAMIEAGMKRKDRQVKANIDKMSATILLQSYLESLKVNF